MSTATHHDLIFGHEGNARAAANVVLIGVLAVLISGAFMEITPTVKQQPDLAHNAANGAVTPPASSERHCTRMYLVSHF